MDMAVFAPLVAAAGALVVGVLRVLEKKLVAAVSSAALFVLAVAAAVENI